MSHAHTLRNSRGVRADTPRHIELSARGQSHQNYNISNTGIYMDAPPDSRHRAPENPKLLGFCDKHSNSGTRSEYGGGNADIYPASDQSFFSCFGALMRSATDRLKTPTQSIATMSRPGSCQYGSTRFFITRCVTQIMNRLVFRLFMNRFSLLHFYPIARYISLRFKRVQASRAILAAIATQAF